MRAVSIIGASMTQFGALKDRTLRDLIVEAGEEALRDAGLGPEAIDMLVVGNMAAPVLGGQNHLGPFAAAALGMPDVPAVHVEAACGSGGAAVREAVLAVSAGAADSALVIGVEKLTGPATGEITQALACAADVDTEVQVGTSFASLLAMATRRYMYELGTTREELAAVAVKNHRHGLLNPKAHLRKAVTLEDVLNAPMVADPLTRFDCSPISDGAAAVVVCARERARDRHARPIDVLGHGAGAQAISLHDLPTLTEMGSSVRAGQVAYRMAGLGPAAIDVAELHDGFTIVELLALEGLGFFDKGEAGAASYAGLTALEGPRPVNPSGGLKSKGHPVGASGVAQVYEIVHQLRGTAGERQVAGAEVGLVHSIGGSGATCVVHILGRGF